MEKRGNGDAACNSVNLHEWGVSMLPEKFAGVSCVGAMARKFKR